MGTKSKHISGSKTGPDYLNMEYDMQLQRKQAYLNQLLKDYAAVDPIVGMDEPHYYRNKVCAEFRRLKDGRVISGRYQEGTHHVIETKGSVLEDRRADAILQTIAELFRSFKVQLYNEDTGTGLLRHVMVRTAYQTGEIMVIFVTASPVFPSKKNISRELIKRHPEVTTIIQNINSKHTNMVLGERSQTLYGKGYIEDILCGKRFRLSPGSFYQVNSAQTEKLYARAIKYADLKKKEIVFDAYCGIGTIGIIASDYAAHVIGVELNANAIHDAKINSRLNGVTQADWIAADAGRFMVRMAEQGEPVDVVFMDPPRSGSSREFLSSLVRLSPKKVVYISCGPESLARDLHYLTGHGYKVIKITPYDLFPFTRHVETIVGLQRRDT